MIHAMAKEIGHIDGNSLYSLEAINERLGLGTAEGASLFVSGREGMVTRMGEFSGNNKTSFVVEELTHGKSSLIV